MAKGGESGSVGRCNQRVSTGYLKLLTLLINVCNYRLLMFVSPDVRRGACLCCNVSRVHVERRSFTPIIVIPINQDLSLMSNLWIILGFTWEWGKGSHNIISTFKTQCLKCPYCPFSSVSIKSSYCPYCPRVHKVSALSRLSSNEVSWLSGHPGWGGGVHPQRRSVTTRIYWLLHFGPWTRYTLWMVEL